MNLTRFYAVAGVVLVAMLLLAGWGFSQVGTDAQVPVHWGANGEVDGWTSSLVGFLMTPAITAAVVGLMAVIPHIEPRRENLRRSASAYRTVATAVVLFLGVLQVGIVLAGVTGEFPVATALSLGIGMLFIVMGNVLTTVRPNFLFGVRTPWTLTSDRSWDRTHRLMGRGFVVAGIGILALGVTGQLPLVIGFMLVAVAVIVVGGFWYSYRVWKADPDRHSSMGSAS